MNCPNCTAPMEHVALEGVYGPEIEIDLCFGCHVLWLDKRESLQLSPGGTLDLFRMLNEHRDDPRHALKGSPWCPRCDAPLSLAHDIGKGGRFSYYDCPNRDGRLTPFSEFLKEKQFVRSLTPLEKQKLSAEVKQVDCSGCGAPVQLEGEFKCGHCGSPLTVLDPEAVQRALRDLDQADAARKAVDPAAAEARARAIAAMESTRTDPNEHLDRYARRRGGTGLGTDLLSLSIGLIFGDY